MSAPARPGGGSAPRAGITQLRVGRLVKAHGLKGALKVELYTDDPAHRFVPGASFSLQVPQDSPWHGQKLQLIELRWYNSQPVAFFEGVTDRTGAEALVKAILWVDQETSELPEEHDAWYDHQLVGLKVVRDGKEVGRIVRVDHFPAQDLLVVLSEGNEILVPFIAAFVPEVNIAAGTVTLTPPNGLFEELVDAESEADARTVHDESVTAEGTENEASPPA